MKTIDQINELNGLLEAAQRENSYKIAAIKKQLKDQWNKIFDNDKQLLKDAENALNASEYQANEDGIYSWFRVSIDLENYEDAKEYLNEWIQDKHGLTLDWENDCFLNYLGDDNIMIQDDTRRDNGVWQNNKLIINEEDYKTEDGEVDIDKRNALIEAHMEKTGYFPGVFRITQYGDIYLVNTQKKSVGA